MTTRSQLLSAEGSPLSRDSAGGSWGLAAPIACPPPSWKEAAFPPKGTEEGPSLKVRVCSQEGDCAFCPVRHQSPQGMQVFRLRHIPQPPHDLRICGVEALCPHRHTLGRPGLLAHRMGWGYPRVPDPHGPLCNCPFVLSHSPCPHSRDEGASPPAVTSDPAASCRHQFLR